MESISSAPLTTPPAMVKFEPVAIVGIGMRAPGGIDSLPSLWDTVVHRKSHNGCLATDPRFLRRFDPEDFSGMFSITPDAKTTLHANLLDETPGLDESYFGVNKRDSACMDVQQKLLLHVAHEALEDAGFSGAADGSAFDPVNFGVYVGATWDDNLKDPQSFPMDIYHLVRTQRAFLSGQISHHFGLSGPAVTVDTVCAGAMTALQDACRALMTGECSAAIAGGVHVMSPVHTPSATNSLKLAGFLDPTGQCKPFLADGAGYSRAEACGLAVLKRLSDAIRDGDRIHGVIRGIGAGNMAAAKSIVRPDGRLQSFTLAKAVASSGIDPADITFIEAHGPGTQQGDPAEVFSICSAIAQHGNRKPTNPLVIGSIKGNIGHAEAASGAISLFKVLAMMKYQRLPPQATFHVTKLNPRLQPFFEKYPIRVSDSEQKWEASRRIAVVSNFGASGFAGHLVVEEPPSSYAPSVRSPQLTATPLPFVLSAKDPSTLIPLARSYADWLEDDGASVPLSDISYSTTARRIVHPNFVLLQAQSHAELARQLRDDSLSPFNTSSQRRRTLAFCFSGQGGPRLDPRLSSLYEVSASFSSTVDTCFRLSETEQLIAPEDVEALELFALQAGLAEMWASWGVTPVALAGHSFGEYIALFRAGVLTLRDALMIIGIRASLIRKKCIVPPSKMAALRLPLSAVYKLLDGQQTTRVELACINSEDRVTLAGTQEDLKAFHGEVLKDHPTARWQLVDNMKAAFHSRFVESLREDFLKACKDITFHPPKTVVLSGPLGHTLLPGDDAVLQPDYLYRHCRETNKFGKAILDFKGRNEAAGTYQPDWIELGPHSTTIGFIPFSSDQLKLSSHYKGASGWTTTLDTLVTLRKAGHAIDFAAFHRDVNPTARHIDLPRYPFQLQPHVYPTRRNSHLTPGYSANSTIYPRVKAKDLAPILKGHIVYNHPWCPASVYMALVLAASSEQHKDRSAFRLSHFTMTAPFTNLTDDWLQVRGTISSAKAIPSSFDVISKSGQVHASMQVDVYEESALLDNLSLLKPLVLSLRSIKTSPETNILGTRLIYDLFSQTVSYAPHCQGLQRVWVSQDGHQACALSSNASKEVAHRHELEPASLRYFSPILIDQAFQLVGLLINISPARGHDEIFVANGIDQVEIAWSKMRNSGSFESYASFELAEGNNVAIGQVYTFDHEQRLVAAFRGFKMRRMKRRVVEHLTRMAAGEPEVSKPSAVSVTAERMSTPMLTPKGEDGNISLNDHRRKKVSAIVQKKLGVDQIPVDRRLAEFGLDSLIAVEITVEIGRMFPEHKLPGELLAKPDTTLATIFDNLHLSGDTKVSKNLTTPPAAQGMLTPSLTPKDEDDNISLNDQRRKLVSALVQEKLCVDNIPVDRKLVELGLDSLIAVEITVEIGRVIPECKLPSELLVKPDTTLSTLFDTLHLSSSGNQRTLDVNAINRKLSSSGADGEGASATPGVATSTSSLPYSTMTVLDHIGTSPEQIQDKPGTVPLMLIHDGGGTALAYRLLGDVGHTLLGVHNPGVRDGKSIVSVRHAADEYASLARRWIDQSPRGPSRIIVGGWSLGGIIALSLAASHPDLVSGVILLDSPPPGTAAMKPDEAEHLFPSAGTSHSGGFGSLIRTQLKMNSRSWSADADSPGGYQALTARLTVPVYLVSAIEPARTLNVGNSTITPSPGSCSAWMLSPNRAEMAESAWKECLGNLLVGSQRSPGDHFSMFTPIHAGSMTRAVREALHTLKARISQGSD